jgi:hypothetical protein
MSLSDFGDQCKNLSTNFKVIKHILRHLESYSCIINKVDKTKNILRYIFLIKRISRGSFFLVKRYWYLKSPTSFPMRFWHFKCVKYANTPI